MVIPPLLATGVTTTRIIIVGRHLRVIVEVVLGLDPDLHRGTIVEAGVLKVKIITMTVVGIAAVTADLQRYLTLLEKYEHTRTRTSRMASNNVRGTNKMRSETGSWDVGKLDVWRIWAAKSLDRNCDICWRGVWRSESAEIFSSIGTTLRTPRAHIPWCKRLVAEERQFNFFASQLRIRIEMAFRLMVKKWGILARPLTIKLNKVKALMFIRKPEPALNTEFFDIL